MTNAPAGELTASTIINLLKAGSYPPEVVVNIAKGFLPLPQEDLVAVLAYLSRFPDQQIATLAHHSLSEIPVRVVYGLASNENAPPEHLAFLARATEDISVLQALIRNRELDDEVIVELAQNAEPAVQEVIVINQARILRTPRILDALLENPRLSGEARRRALETREEFFDKKARLAALIQEEDSPPDEAEMIDQASLDAIKDLLAQAEADKVAPEPLPLPELADSDVKGKSIWAMISGMTVSEKVQLAFKGNKTVRSILVRDRNRLVSSATMRNPRMTENEVESIAGMRNVEEEVLRLIGMRRDWTSKYNIVVALARNPKAPLGVVLPLINRLTLRDLKSLKDDKGVSEAVRVNARKFYQAKQK